MFRKEKNQEHFYRISLGSIQTICLASSYEEAASVGVKSILENFKEDAELSIITTVEKIHEETIDSKIFKTSILLQDLGFFNLAKNFEEICHFLLDKSENDLNI